MMSYSKYTKYLQYYYYYYSIRTNNIMKQILKIIIKNNSAIINNYFSAGK